MASRVEKAKVEFKKKKALEWAKDQEKGYGPTAVKLPDGIEFYKLEEGMHSVEPMPYGVTKGRKEKGGNPACDAGFYHYERKYDVHRIPGPDGTPRAYCCRRICFGQPCPACEWLQMNQGIADEELVKQIKNQTRRLFLVNPKPGKPKVAFQVLDVVHWNRKLGFGEQLVNYMNMTGKESDPDICDLEEGKTIKFKVESKYKQIVSLLLVPREYSYPESMLEKSINLDDCLVDIGYEDMKDMLDMGGKSGEDEAEEELPRKSKHTSHEGNGDSDEGEVLPKKKTKPVAKDDEEEKESDSDDGDDDNDGEEKKAPEIKVGTDVAFKAKGTRYTGTVESVKGEYAFVDIGAEKHAKVKLTDLMIEKEEEDEPEEDSDDNEFKVGDKVEHEDFGVCTVTKVNKGGTVNLKDKKNKDHKQVDVDDLEEYTEKTEKTEVKTKAKAKKEPDEDDNGEDDSEDPDDGDDDELEEDDD